MLGVRHPFTGALYEQDGNGNVLVSLGESWGRFTRQGRWVDGEMRECDPQLCGWVSGPVIANHRMIESVPPHAV